MADDRTTVSELATALGMLGHGTVGWAVLQRPAEVPIDDGAWEQLEHGLHDPALHALGEAAFDNGGAFARHAEGLGGRRPGRIEWTGGHRPPGDQVIPADLRVDHVYLVSCKYLSKVVHNAAPARVFVHLLKATDVHDRADWYGQVAPAAHRDLAAAAPSAGGPRRRPAVPRSSCCGGCCGWRRAPYFVLGAGVRDVIRLRIDTPWDWRQRFELRTFAIEPDEAGQPQVRWAALVLDRAAAHDVMVEGHVEVRWSHGRFAGPPEAKVYLDTPHAEVPGYVPLD